MATKGAYVAIVGLIAVATVAGLVALWPKGDAPSLQFVEGVNIDETFSAEVEKVTDYTCELYATSECQRVAFELTSGPDEGQTNTAEVNVGVGTPEFAEGDSVRVIANEVPPGAATAQISPYVIVDFERKPPLLVLALIFAALVIVFGRLRGALSLVGLAISLAIVLVFVVPALLRDSSPLAVALVGAMAVMLTTIPLAHGLGPKSLAAITGTAVSLGLVVGLAIVFTDAAHLTGLGSDQAATLGANSPDISLQGLLIAGMVIGSLGVLDDVTISQASTVMALRAANPAQGFGELFRRAIDVGRDHVSATVNTLVLAYVGTSLTTLLIFGSGQVGFTEAVNLEIIASVVVATLVGSIGLILAVPITTALACLLAEGISEDELAREGESGHVH